MRARPGSIIIAYCFRNINMIEGYNDRGVHSRWVRATMRTLQRQVIVIAVVLPFFICRTAARNEPYQQVHSHHNGVDKLYWNWILQGDYQRLLATMRQQVERGNHEDYFEAINQLIYAVNYHFKDAPPHRQRAQAVLDQILNNIRVSSQHFSENRCFNVIKYLLQRHVKSEPQTAGFVQTVLQPIKHNKIPEQNYAALMKFIQTQPTYAKLQRAYQATAMGQLQRVLGEVVSTGHAPQEVRQTARNFIPLIQQELVTHPVCPFKNLIDLLPPGSDPHNFLAITSFLSTTENNLPRDILPIDYYNREANQHYLVEVLRNILNCQSKQITAEIRRAAYYYLRYFELDGIGQNVVKVLPKLNGEYYQTLSGFLQSPQFRYIVLRSPHINVYMSPRNLLFKSLQLMQNQEVPQHVRQAVNYYINYYRLQEATEKYSFNELLSGLQSHVTHENRHYFESVKQFFSSETILEVLQSNHIQPSDEYSTLLHEIFEKSIRSTFVSYEYKKAFAYFLAKLFNQDLSTTVKSKLELSLQDLSSICNDQASYETIAEFLTGPMVTVVLENEKIDHSLSNTALLEKTLDLMQHAHYLEANQRQAAANFKQQLHQVDKVENQVINRLEHTLETVATHSKDEHNLHVKQDLEKFLHSDNMHQILRHAHVDYNRSEDEVLYEILTIAAEDNNVQKHTREEAVEFTKTVMEPYMGTFKIDIMALLRFLPQPTNQLTIGYFNTLKNYLTKGIPRHLIPHLDFDRTPHALLADTLEALISSEQIPAEVRSVARYYWHTIRAAPYGVINMNRLRNKFDELTLLIPQPTTVQEIQYYNMLTKYLRGQLIIRVIHTANISLQKSDVRILKDLLICTLNSKIVYPELKMMAKYYLAMITSGMIGDVHSKYDTYLFGIGRRQAANSGSTTTSTGVSSRIQSTAATNYLSTSKTSASSTTASRSGYSTGSSTTASNLSSVLDTRMHQGLSTTASNSSSILDTRMLQGLSTASSSTNSTNSQLSSLATKSTLSSSSGSSTVTSSAGSSSSTTSTQATHIDYSSKLTTEQKQLLQKMETELSKIETTYLEDRNVLRNYLHSDMALNLLATSKTDMEQSSSDLLAEFVDIAAHTNDIPNDLRLASEHYVSIIPKLAAVATTIPHIHIKQIDAVFHKLKRPTEDAVRIDLYNAIDRYLHSDVPSIILRDSTVKLDKAPMELLVDLLKLARDEQLNVETILEWIRAIEVNQTMVSGPQLDHLYRLDKMFQLIQLPSEAVDYYYTIGTYLQSNQVYEILQKGDVDFNIELKALLEKVLTLTMDCTTLSNDVIQAAVYFYNTILKPDAHTEIDNIMHLITMEDKNVQESYKTVFEFMHTDIGKTAIQTVDLNFHQRPTVILENLLSITSQNSHVAENVRQAAKILYESVKQQNSQILSTSKTMSSYSRTTSHSISTLSSTSSTATTTATKSEEVKTNYTKYLHDVSSTEATLTGYPNFLNYIEHTPELLTTEEITTYSGNDESLLKMVLMRVLHNHTLTEEISSVAMQLLKDRYYNYGSLISLLPMPSFDTEETIYQEMATFFNSVDIYDLDILTNSSETNLEALKKVLIKIKSSTTCTTTVRSAASYYLSHRPFFDYALLVPLIPTATNDNIKKLRATISSFLEGNQVNLCTRDISAQDYDGHEDELLHVVLQAAIDCTALEESVRIAAKYYLRTIKSVAVSMRRVMTKTLNLVDVFAEAFDISEFNAAQFDAYDDLLGYVSSRTEQLMASNKFDFWAESQQSGKFTLMFLGVLREQTDIPENILRDIDVLMPLLEAET